MKRLLILGLLLVYLPMSTGVFASAHFCGDERASFQLFNTEHPSCGCKAEVAMNCCHDVHVFIKVAQEHQASSIKAPIPVSKEFSTTWVHAPSYLTAFERQIIYGEWPPDPVPIPARILFGNFRN